MKYLRYYLQLLNHYLVKIVIFICRVFEKLGIFKETCREFIASYDLGYVSSQYKQENYGVAYQALRKYETYSNDYTHGFLKYYLGLIYYNGHVVNENKERAEIFFIQAGELGNEEAMEYLNKKSKKVIKH